MDNQKEGGVGAIVGIIIIILILVLGGIYFYMEKVPKNVPAQNQVENTNSDSLEADLDAGVNIDISNDEKALDESFQ